METIKKVKKTNICQEAPVKLFVNGKLLITFMCTPFELESLAIGHLYTRSFFTNPLSILGIRVCSEFRKIDLIIDKKNDELFSTDYLPNILLTSCGSGTNFDNSIFQNERVVSSFSVPLAKLKELFITTLDSATIYKKTGGMHCSTLFINNEIFISEDIGRHNSVDKSVGKFISTLKNKNVNLNDLFCNSLVITTGRISVDMVLKAVNSKIPIIASRSIPSDLAIDIANKMGITLVGRLNSMDPIIYTYPKKIIL